MTTSVNSLTGDVTLVADHHGYPHARELMSGQASKEPFGSPVFVCAGKTGPLFHLVLVADLGGLPVSPLRSIDRFVDFEGR